MEMEIEPPKHWRVWDLFIYIITSLVFCCLLIFIVALLNVANTIQRNHPRDVRIGYSNSEHVSDIIGFLNMASRPHLYAIPDSWKNRDNKLDRLCDVSYDLLRLIKGLQLELDCDTLDKLHSNFTEGRVEGIGEIIHGLKIRLNLKLSMENVPEGSFVVGERKLLRDNHRSSRSLLAKVPTKPRKMKVPEGIKEFFLDNEALAGILDYVKRLRQICFVDSLIGYDDKFLKNISDKCACSLF